MKEIADIVAAYDLALQAGKACALATVVHVEGSSYRRPGARMLVTDDGKITGAISGGCLEGDALRKALLAMNESCNRLVTYDTMDEDDAKFGVQLGCNGIVHILFEPVAAAAPHHPLRLLKEVMNHRRAAVLSTVFSLADRALQPGTICLSAFGESIVADACTLSVRQMQTVQQGAAHSLDTASTDIQACEDGLLSFLHQFIPPPVALLIAGAGNDAMPLVTMANVLGWEVTLADGRSTHANRQRFPQVKQLLVAKPVAASQQAHIDKDTVCVLMSHNYNYDLDFLKELIATDTPYIGILGPKSKMSRMYADLEKEGICIHDDQRIHSPVGLDIGAETAEEIALSIAAEIQAKLTHKNARMLREKQAAVHA